MKWTLFLRRGALALSVAGALVLAAAACLSPASAAGAAQDQKGEKEAGFASLFNGKNLDGWQLRRAERKGFVVEEGLLVCPTGSGGYLFTKKEYADFVLRFEFRMEEGANSGVAIRTPLLDKKPAYQGIEIQILDNPRFTGKLRPTQYHGSIYDVVPARLGALKPIGQWNDQEIVCHGRQITVKVNGQTVVDVNLDDLKDAALVEKHPGLQRASGHVGFLGHGDRVEFRHVRIKEFCEGSEIFFRKIELHPLRRDAGMSEPLRIVALGDSITHGVGSAGVTEADTFRDIVRRELTARLGFKVEVVNAGVNGDIVTAAVGRLKRDVLDRKPDLVTVMFGGNDAGFYRPETDGFAETPRVSRDDFGSTLGKIVDRLRAEGITVVLMTCPPMTDRYGGMHLEPYQEHGVNFLVKDYAQTMRDVAAEKGVELIDVYRAFRQEPSAVDYFPDGLHPDARGHRVIADLLVRRLSGILGRRPPAAEK